MNFKHKVLDLSRPRIMGILNVTPDSFSDGGRFWHLDGALRQAEKMVAQGAHFIDVGGESTRPGAADVSLQQELERVIPVIEAIRANLDTIISIDTSKAEVMTEAVKAGAALINDVRALREPGALEAAAQSGAAVCLMHMQGQPRTMQTAPHYMDVVHEVMQFLAQRVEACRAVGISEETILLDPGFGFGKTMQHNYRLLAALSHFHALGMPLLVGMSRKSMIGNLLDRKVDERLPGSLACAMLAAQQGAHILRVHDVQETADVLRVLEAVRMQQEQSGSAQTHC